MPLIFRSFRAMLGLSLLTVPAFSADKTKVLRGPYLQSATPNSIVVRWRTDKLNKSLVLYGLSLSSMTNKATSAGDLADHVVPITGLKPSTKYYYAIASATNQVWKGGTEDYYFITPPKAGPAKPTRVWVIGDAGTANTNQMSVRNAFYAYTRDRRPDLWLMLGDNAYPNGTDKEYQRAVFDMYADLLRYSPVWPTIGNHDGHTANSPTQSGIYFDIFTLPTLGQAGGVASGTEAYYSYDYAHIHFVCLDSEGTDRSPMGGMAKWLKADLDATKRDWIIAYFHHPPYTKGSHDSDNKDDSGSRLVDMRKNLGPILEEGGVDMVLTGHSHCYERSWLIDGHYGLSKEFNKATMVKNGGDGRPDSDGAYTKASGTPAHAGTVYVVAGSSGQTSGGKLNHPAMYLSLNKLGSLVLDIDGNELNAVFLGAQGQKRDYFTIRKPAAAATPQ
jgi:hypothetical protein